MTRVITEPEVTPVLKGSCLMQGSDSVDEADSDFHMNKELPQVERAFGRHSNSWKVLESGICNVCSAPCSTCLHTNQALMGSKTDEFSDEIFQGNAGSQYSVYDMVPVQNTACDNGQCVASETSNLVSINSSYDSFSENAESKSSLRTHDASGAFEDVEMHLKLSSAVPAGDDQVPVKSLQNSDQRALRNKLESRKIVEGCEDSISCVSGGNDAKKLVCCDNGNVGRKNVPHSAASDKLSLHKIDLAGVPSIKDSSEGVSICFCPGNKSHSCNLNVRGLEEDLGFHLPVELPEYSKRHLNSLSTKETVSDSVWRQRSALCGGTDDFNLVWGDSAVADNVCLNLEVGTEKGKGSCDLLTEPVNSSEQIEEIEKVKELCGIPGVQETALQSQLIDDSDGSDIMEHDVKVCDTCGDAGREDLLAMCSRCSDGAEHTYCMREMVGKVPEGDWLCEECKFDEEIKNVEQDKIFTEFGNEKNPSSGLANALDISSSVKLDKKDSDVEGNITNKNILSVKASTKRRAESIEVTSAVKRQALQPTVASPRTSNPCRTGVLLRDLSFISLNKGKVKPAHQLSSGTCFVKNTSEAALSPTGPCLQMPHGTLLKSNSFNSTNAKSKVKPVDEVVPQKQKSAREPSSLNMKEGAVRLMGKSMSFKSLSPGGLNPSESKVKMLSPKLSSGQDLKGLKQVKEWKALERKNSFKSERSVSSTMGNTNVPLLKGDKKLASESYSLPSVSNHREPKGVLSDSKLSILSKSASHVAHRGSEMPGPLGEMGRQACLPSVAGASLTNGSSVAAVQKANQTSLVYDSTSGAKAKRTYFNANECLPESLPQCRESANLGERTGESSVNCTRPGIAACVSDPYPKCKEIGHSAQFCSVDYPRSLLGDASSARSSREVMDKGNKLKAAIEAAMLKKPGIYRKNKMPNQSDELSVSGTDFNNDIRPEDQSTSINTRSIFPADEVQEGQAILQDPIAESCKQTAVKNIKGLSASPSEADTSKTKYISLIDHSDGKPFIEDLCSHALPAVSVLLKMSTIPQHEYVWQGSFEVWRSGNFPELRDGIQAHLSTCASPKVIEAVNKFPPKIVLNEVPRLSTWPVQFQEIGVKEDDIALYFFAKDLESYEKSYKSLLEVMMKSDLALKGNFNGVELLVFSSKHLPEKSQRWNMMYFLWGVFRGKKVDLQDVSGSSEKYRIPRDLPTCSKGSNVALPSDCPVLMCSPCLSSETVNGDCNSVSFLDPKGHNGQRVCVLSLEELRCSSTSLDENVDPGSKLDVNLQPSVQATGTINGSKKSEKIPMYPDNAPDSRLISTHSIEVPGRVVSHKTQVTFERNLKDEGSSDTKVVTQRDPMMTDQTVKDLNSLQYNHQKHLLEHSSWTVSQASASTSETFSWSDVNSGLLDRGCASKKEKTGGYSGLRVYNSSNNTSLIDVFKSGILDVATGFPIKERGDEAYHEREVYRNTGNPERYFFPVDAHPVTKFRSSDDSALCNASMSKDDDWLPHAVPNLNLALGAEMKPSKQGVLPSSVGKVELKDGRDQPPDRAATEEEEDVVSASLSLSLSFPV